MVFAAQGPVDMEEGGDEVDPLDAFMAGNDADMLQELEAAEVAEKAGTGAQQQMEVDEVDPLDAFMNGGCLSAGRKHLRC